MRFKAKLTMGHVKAFILYLQPIAKMSSTSIIKLGKPFITYPHPCPKSHPHPPFHTSLEHHLTPPKAAKISE
jgi:hypothetical protein